MEVVERRRMLREEAVRQAREFLGSVKPLLGKLSAALIGSYARGDFNEWSDIDLLIVSEEFDPNPLRRWNGIIEAVSKYPGVEPILLTPREFLRQVRLGTPMAEEALGRGIVLADELGIFKVARDMRGRASDAGRI